MRIAPILVILALAVCGPSSAQIIAQEGQPSESFTQLANRTLVHEASGFAFPASLGEMPRRKRVLFSADNVSVQYTLRGGGNGDSWIDVFVFPATLTLEQEAEAIATAIETRLDGKRVSLPLTLPAAASGAKVGWFHGKLDDHSLTTGFALAKRGNWYIKVRVTNPDQAGEAGMRRIQGAVSALHWDWKPVASRN